MYTTYGNYLSPEIEKLTNIFGQQLPIQPSNAPISQSSSWISPYTSTDYINTTPPSNFMNTYISSNIPTSTDYMNTISTSTDYMNKPTSTDYINSSTDYITSSTDYMNKSTSDAYMNTIPSSTDHISTSTDYMNTMPPSSIPTSDYMNITPPSNIFTSIYNMNTIPPSNIPISTDYMNKPIQSNYMDTSNSSNMPVSNNYMNMIPSTNTTEPSTNYMNQFTDYINTYNMNTPPVVEKLTNEIKQSISTPMEAYIDSMLESLSSNFREGINYMDFIIVSFNNKLIIISNSLLKKVNNLLNKDNRPLIKQILFDLFTSLGNINLVTNKYSDSYKLLLKDIINQYSTDNSKKNMDLILSKIKNK